MNDLTLWEQEYKKLEPNNIPKPVNDMTDTWRRDVIARKRVELWRMQQQYGVTAAPCQRLGLRINQIVQQDLDLPDAWEDNHDAATEQLIASLPAENPYKEGSVEYRLVELAQGKMATGSEGMRDGSRRQAASQRVVDRIIEDIEYHKATGTFDAWAEDQVARLEKVYGDPPAGMVWFGKITQYGKTEYICIGNGDYDDAILHLCQMWEGKPQGLHQQNRPDRKPCRVKDTANWNEVKRTGATARKLSDIASEYGGLRGNCEVKNWLAQLENNYGEAETMPEKDTQTESAPDAYRVPESLVRAVRGYYESNKDKANRNFGENWLRVLIAFGDTGDFQVAPGLTPFTAAEARTQENVWSGWKPVREALEKIEGGSQQDEPPVEAAPEAAAVPETRQADDNQPLVAPAHKLRFLKWLQVEREMAVKINGAGHPVVKHDVFGKLIEYVEQDVPDNRGDLQVQYDNFKSWLNGDFAQEQPDGSMKMGDETELTPEEKAYKAGQDAYAAEVAEYQKWRDETGSKMKFDDWKWQKAQQIFTYNGVYVTDARNGCSINWDKVAKRRHELTAENVRYRLSRPPNGPAQISWLALNYEGCLCHLPNNTETETRMVPAEEVRQLIIDGYDVLTPEQYAYNQRVMHSRDDKFAAFSLFVQTAPDGRYLGVCPHQSDPSGPWTVDQALFDAIKGDSSQARAVVVPDDIAEAIERGDWATVARLAGERA